MKANRAYRLIVRRGGWMPAALADPDRVDHIEVVEVDSGEVVLFWDCPPQIASRRGARRAGGPLATRGPGVPGALGYRGELMAAYTPRPRDGARVAADDDADPALRGARGGDVRTGKIGGFLHLSIGEEATIVGSAEPCARRTT